MFVLLPFQCLPQRGCVVQRRSDSDGAQTPAPVLVGTLLRRVPAAFGWMRTRWSCACLALTLSRQLGYEPSAETVRRERV
jgi:hypothetical protein